MERGAGLVLVGVGLVVAAVGLLVWSGAFDWFGRLPGDIRMESANSRVFVPITSMILVSVVATVVLNVIVRLFR